MSVPKMPEAVRAAFEDCPDDVRDTHMQIRRMIFEIAENEAAGPLLETLKWGQPSYLNPSKRIGTTVRLGWNDARPAAAVIYVHCQTDLIERFRMRSEPGFKTEGSRALFVDATGAIDEGPLAGFLADALTYHRRRKAR